MTGEQKEGDETIRQRIAEEEAVRQITDENGHMWIKVYFGGGAHFKNWLSQCVELKGEENVRIEEVDSVGFKCYENSGDKMHRIWVRDCDAE